MVTGADILPNDEEYDVTDDDWSDYDHCYECTGYGDDYYLDEDGDWVSACDDCPYNTVNGKYNYE